MIVLLAGGGGNINLDGEGCPTNLSGNTLIRLRDALRAWGFATAMVDAPADMAGGDGLAGFRADARIEGAAAPVAAILLSTITQGFEGGRKPWVAQTVFDTPLREIDVPTLVMAHALDGCPSTPSARAQRVVDRIGDDHARLVVVEGGPAAGNLPQGLKACVGSAPHGFGGQDDIVLETMAAFLTDALAAGR